jgi:hypothetical protein
MDNSNLSILVEAKKEYLYQLYNIMGPFMIETFQEIYNESVKISKGKKVLIQFQRLLKEVPNWNDLMLTQHKSKLVNTCSWFNDLLAAVFVSFVKILSAVRLKAENKKISIKLPSTGTFIHSCYVNAAKDLYKDPYIFHEEMSEYDRDEKLMERFSKNIKISIEELIPIQEILKSCMSQQTEEVEVEEPEDNLEETLDPDVIEDGDETEPVPMVPETEAVTEPETTEAVPAVPEAEAVPEDERKIIPVKQHTPEDDVLFADARD